MNAFRDYFCRFLALLAVAAFAGQISTIRAMETDQYNLPPTPLADIGEEFSEYVEERLVTAINVLNSEIVRREACLDGVGEKCDTSAKESKKLAELRTSEALAHAVYKQLGDGSIFTTKTGKWLNSHKFAHEPARFKPRYSESIFVTRPINHATLSPTVRMYGVEFGTDKMDHFFQQGHQYLERYRKERAKGRSESDAVSSAIKWGQKTERTYFGTLVSGVYSNADLFANYAGLKFYRGLTESANIGDTLRPAAAELRDGKWFYQRGRSDLLRPFITGHLNEALNPSGFSFLLSRVVKRVVKKRACPEWAKAFPELTRNDYARVTASYEAWNGEDYGFTKKSGTVTIADTCFDDTSRTD